MTPGVQVANPLQQHSIWQEGHKPEPCAIVIFGATGDLAQRKLLPTLAHLMHDHPLPESFCIVAYARKPLNDEQWRAMALESLSKYMPEDDKLDSEGQQAFAKKLFYCQGNLDEDAGYHKLSELLDKLDKEQDTKGNRIFYLSTPPEMDPMIIGHLGSAGLAQPEWQQGANGHGWTRIIIEKPFGHDLASAQELNEDIGQSFREDQIFRIDHYMGKETVQNILAFRFSNSIFEPLWNRNLIDHVQILVAESLSIGSRSEYYESEGAIRDMVQNHIMQVLCLTCMEAPAAFDADSIRNEKVKLVRAIPLLTPEQVSKWTVRGQYTAGVSGGKPTVGYLEENGVNPHSTTETFVALKLFIENWRWSEVPFYIRTGKCLPSRSTEVTIQFKRVPHQLYNPEDTKGLVPNRLTIRIQPDDGISLKFAAKIPGAAQHLASVDMNFSYKTAFGIQSPEAYERLIADCMLGDSTLFIRRDEIEASWRVIDSITKVWQKMDAPDIHPYVAGTWGPKEADALVEKDGREWDNPSK
ncbi:MAG: glucose-6-phosphate dehydrogenase [Ktedonobacteraceae bacterium]